MTEDQLATQEKFDSDVYTSNKNMFETLLYMAVDETDLEKRKNQIKTLIECYNNMSDGNCRLVGRIRRLENRSC